MASSDNLASMEPWTFRTPFAESWISEAYARDTETLTKALQKSLSDHHQSDAADAAAIYPFFKPEMTPPAAVAIQTLSGSNSSDPETPASSSKRRMSIPVNVGKPTKRKSRASKRTTTTFITADPANFRQMVQQVTGVRFGGGNSHLPLAPSVLKPEPQRLGVNRAIIQGCLPTLDTSAFLLDHHHHRQVLGGPAAADMAGNTTLPQSLTVPPPPALDGGAGLDFDSYSSFPTLESWKAL